MDGQASNGQAPNGQAPNGQAPNAQAPSRVEEAVALIEQPPAAEARVLQRLERIEALDRERAPAGELLGELRALVHEAEAWARTHADAGGAERPEKLREEAEGMR